MDVRHLELFVAVADEGSIRAAARRMFIAQPQLSQIVRRLERDLGVTLLERSARGVVLTPAGHTLYGRARSLIEHLGETVDLVRGAASRRPLVVGLVAGQMAAAELTIPILTAFRAAHPDIGLVVRELDFREHYQAVSDEQVDVAIVRPPCQDDGLDLAPLFDEPRMLCVHRTHAMADADSLTVDDVLGEPMLDLVEAPPSWTGFWSLDDVRGESAQSVAAPAVTVAEIQFTLLLEPVVSTVAASTWRMGYRHPDLRIVPVDDATPSRVAVARRPDADDAALAFTRCAQETCRSLIGQVPGARAADPHEIRGLT